MLTGKLVRVRYARTRLVPMYIDTREEHWTDAAERLLEVYRSVAGHTRGELEEELTEVLGNDPRALVQQGLAKLLEDRCDFEVASDHPPDEIRAAAFRAAAERRGKGAFDRAAVLEEVGLQLGLTPEQVDAGLFADLKSEQRLIRFEDITVERLLNRYNVALAQAVLLRATSVQVRVRGEGPARVRQLLRAVKFHRLICDAEQDSGGALVMRLDGPMSLFSATNKYGFQLAMFLPTLLHCKDFDLRADVRWGPQRKEKVFTLSPADGLVSTAPDHGTYVPKELQMFAELFARKATAWEIAEEPNVFPVGKGYWVPDFTLTHKATRRAVHLEVLGFWRRGSAEKHLQMLKQLELPFLLAVSDQYHVEDGGLDGLSDRIHRFRQMPLPDEVARLAGEVLGLPGRRNQTLLDTPEGPV